MYFLLGGLGRFHEARDVTWDKTVGHGLLEGLVQSSMDIVHSARSEPRIELLAVQPSRVGWGKGLEFQPSERWLDVQPRQLLVSSVGGFLHGALNGVGEPPVQIRSECEISSIEGEASLAIRKCLGQLSRNL